jgi:hypothetical protein
VRLRPPTREARLRRVEDAWVRDRPQRSLSAATRKLRQRPIAGDAPPVPGPAG